MERRRQLSRPFSSPPRFSLAIRVRVRQIASYFLRGLVVMRRAQFIELHEQPWFPRSLRHEITNALQFGLNLLKIYAPIAPLLQNSLDSTQCRTIVDMCSGGGGPWLDLSRRLQQDAQCLHILLTDKYPNLKAFQKLSGSSENQDRKSTRLNSSHSQISY